MTPTHAVIRQPTAPITVRGKSVSIDVSGTREGLFTHFLVQQLKAAPARPVSLDQLFQLVRKNVVDASGSKQEPITFGDSKATIAGWRNERILLASLEPTLASAEPAPPSPSPFQPSQVTVDRQLAESFDLEEQAQEVLLRYGEGNHFAGDPLQPGAADFDSAGDLFDRALQNLPALPLKELDDRLRNSLRARMLFCRGGALAYRGRYDEGRRILEQAHDADRSCRSRPTQSESRIWNRRSTRTQSALSRNRFARRRIGRTRGTTWL